MIPLAPQEAWSRLPDPAKAIVREVSARREIHILEIMSQNRTFEVCHARFEVWAHLHNRRYSNCRIGRLFGRDPTSVINGLRRDAELRPRWLAAAE